MSPTKPQTPFISKVVPTALNEEKTYLGMSFVISRPLSEAERRFIGEQWGTYPGWGGIEVYTENVEIPKVALGQAAEQTKALAALLARLPDGAGDWQQRIDARDKAWENCMSEVKAVIDSGKPVPSMM